MSLFLISALGWQKIRTSNCWRWRLALEIEPLSQVARPASQLLRVLIKITRQSTNLLFNNNQSLNQKRAVPFELNSFYILFLLFFIFNWSWFISSNNLVTTDGEPHHSWKMNKVDLVNVLELFLKLNQTGRRPWQVVWLISHWQCLRIKA